MRIKNKNRIRVIGKLIRIYREEKRHNTQNEYTLLRFFFYCVFDTRTSIAGLFMLRKLFQKIYKLFTLSLSFHFICAIIIITYIK